MPIKVLLELRPAFDGHSGIPQETRLLFSSLAKTDGVRVVGLLQSANLVVEPGLPMRGRTRLGQGNASDDIDRLSKVVVSFQQGPASSRLDHLRKRWLRYAGPMGAAAAAMVGLKVRLGAFDPTHFQDFIWRALFANTLPTADFDAVTGAEFRVLRWPWSALHALGVGAAALGHAVYPRLDTTGIDLMIAETPYPGRVSGGTKLIVRYHDAIPLLMPHTIKNRGHHRAMHFHALRRNARDGAWFACVSDATRRDLLSVMPELEPRAITIPNMVAAAYTPETAPAARVPEILWSRKNRVSPHEGGAPVAPQDLVAGELQFLLMVGTVEPRKNHLALLDAWAQLRSESFSRLNLVCVGGLGWEHDTIVQRFAPWLQRGGLHLLHDVPATDLRLLYRHAAATVCPSFGEGFDFSGVEAMRSGGVVAASDIAVHRDVYGDAAAYFCTYSPADLAQVIGGLIAPQAEPRRATLREAGQRVAAQYLPDRVLPQWQAFLQRVLA